MRSPFLSIWITPRQTIRAIVEADPAHLVAPLAAAAGASGGIILAYSLRLPGWLEKGQSTRLAVGAAVGAMLGLIGLYLFGWVHRWVGRWFGGRATNLQVRAALAWADVPVLALFGFWVVSLAAFYGWERAQRGPVGFSALLYAVAMLILTTWQFALKCHTVAEVHGFSAWRGFGTVLIANAAIFVPAVALALIAAIAVPNAARARIIKNDIAAIGHLRALTGALKAYRSAHQGYPGEWYELYPIDAPALGPSEFRTKGPYLIEHPVQGHRYTYGPRGEGGYSLVAVPAQSAGLSSRGFYVDETGRMHHCIPGMDGAAPGAEDALLESAPRPCGERVGR